MDTMEYKGYRGSVRYSAEDRVLHGRILGIDDVVNFEGANVDELEKAFHEAVDDYLALCEKLGRDPDRAYSGKIPLRIDGSLHRRVAIAADTESKSLNSWIAETLEAATSPRRTATGTTARAARKRPAGLFHFSRTGKLVEKKVSRTGKLVEQKVAKARAKKGGSARKARRG